jgi:exodeoxyribonuclease V alpha subunit
MDHKRIPALYEAGCFLPIDIHFARLMNRLAGKDSPEVALAAALVSRAAREGNVCLDLYAVAGKKLYDDDGTTPAVIGPDGDEWCGHLRDSPVVGTPGEFRPLVLHDHRLYLYRYWMYQEYLARSIRDRLAREPEPVDEALLREGLERLFPDVEPGGVSWQRIAAYTAVTKRFCIISGGPGTGKTATVARILALLLEQAGTKRMRMALAAPTGKAAARLTEVIGRARTTMACSDEIKEALPTGASTIHRLLGATPHSPSFRHDEKNPLSVDVVVVDEASMVDLPLMAKLVLAIPHQSRLILLGDKDQLASVEAGSVLGDACDTGRRHGYSRRFRTDVERVTGVTFDDGDDDADERGIQDCVVELRQSYRFDPRSGISRVSAAVNEGDGAAVSRLLIGGSFDDIRWNELPPTRQLSAFLAPYVVKGFKDYLMTADPAEAIERFNEFRIICALREGPYGVARINGLVETILQGEHLITPDNKWYPGRPVMITRNDYSLRLFNGDVGLALPDPESGGNTMVFFNEAGGMIRKLHPFRLPEHETVYAMTVHKSQGSEFDTVLMVLPDRLSPVLTRELIYTGITRARKAVTVWSMENVFRTAVERRIQRTSGLRDALWERGRREAKGENTD